MDLLNYKELYEKSLIEIQELKLHLKKYTAPKRCATFYENHKDELKEKVKEYRNKTNYYKNISPEKLKEYRKRAYEKQKIKKNNLENNNL